MIQVGARHSQDVKDPNETRAYTIDWSDHLGSDSINGSPTWTVESGSVTISSSSVSSNQATALIAGGQLGETAVLNCRIITSAGETLDQSIRVRVRSR